MTDDDRSDWNNAATVMSPSLASGVLAQADAIDPVISGQVLAHLHVPELDE
jgi:hypothetical protein